MPTAGMLPKGSLGFDSYFLAGGGLLVGISVGVLDRFSLGVSYGGNELIGSGTPMMNEVPGIALKVRILEESIGFPALAIGFDSQGQDGYIKGLSRYHIKSPGFYGVVSKNYTLLGFFSLHGGGNYSFETADEDRDVNFFAGVEKSIGPFVSVVLEFNSGLNDNDHQALGKGRGYLNLAWNFSLGSGLTVGINFKDLFKNNGEVDGANRTVRLEYIKQL